MKRSVVFVFVPCAFLTFTTALVGTSSAQTNVPVLTITAPDPIASEAGPDPGQFVVHRDGPATMPLYITTLRLRGTASNGVDYVLTGGLTNGTNFPVLYMAPGVRDIPLTVMPINDTLVEGDETVVLTLLEQPLLPPTEPGFIIGTPAYAVVTIADDDSATNGPPIVRLVQPTNGAVFTLPAVVGLVAQAFDTGGYVATVEFLDGTNSLGVTTNNPLIVGPINPFILVWSNAPPGVHELTAKATDDEGLSSVSDVVHITVLEPGTLPQVSISAPDPTAAETVPGTAPNPGTFLVRRDAGTNMPLKVHLAVNGSASNGWDYAPIGEQIVIPEGEWAVEIPVDPIDDLIPENTESVVVRVMPPPCPEVFPPAPFCYAVGTSAVATVYIFDNDGGTNGTNVATVSISAPDPSASEQGPDPGEFLLHRTVSADTSLTVFLRLGGTASNGLDYAPLAPSNATVFSVTMPAGVVEQVIEVMPLDDALPEGVETVQLSVILPPTNAPAPRYRVGFPASAVVTITDNDSLPPTNRPPMVRILQPTNTSAFPTGVPIFIAVEASDPDGAVATVRFYWDTNLLGVITNHMPGMGMSNLFYMIWSNAPAGGHQLAAQAFDNQGAATVSDPVAITVFERVEQPVVAIFATDPEAAEVPPNSDQPENPAIFTVRRTMGTNMPLTVFLSIGGTASNGLDYVAIPNQVTIPEGEWSADIAVQPIDDLRVEGDERVLVRVEPPVCVQLFPPPPDCYVVGSPREAAATIHDNDFASNTVPVITITASDPNAAEQGPDNGRFTLHRHGPTNTALTVFCRLGGTALNGVDYEALAPANSLTLTVFMPGGAVEAPIVVRPIDDALAEGPESVEVSVLPSMIVGPMEQYRPGWPSNAVVMIADNDLPATNLPPRVAITAPHDGEVIAGQRDINIEATTLDPDGYASRVEFFANNERIAAQELVFIQPPPPNSPLFFHVTWSNVVAGDYVLTARTWDNLGATGVSEAVRISVVSTNPVPTNALAVVNITALDAFASEGMVCFGPGSPWGTNVWGSSNRFCLTNIVCVTNPAVFKVWRSGPTNDALTVLYAVGGTASNGVDYLGLPGSVTIPAGERSARIVVLPVDDNVPEPIETVVLELVRPPENDADPVPAYAVGPLRRAAAFIIDNDRPPPPTQVFPERLFHVMWPAANGWWYRVEASTDLVQWTTLCTNMVMDGAVHFVDSDAPTLPNRFYRIVPEPVPPAE